MKMEGNKKMPTPRQEVIHNPIPTPLLCCCFIKRKHNTKTHNIYYIYIKWVRSSKKQRCKYERVSTGTVSKDVGMGL